MAVSCAKQEFSNHQESSELFETSDFSTFAIPTVPFDWENADTMPTPLGSTQVIVPWGSTASRQIPDEIVHDYKGVDGWELVYNTFNTTSISDHLYFMLYNKFRGVLRMYYYTKPTSYIQSSNIVHSLMLMGSNKSNSPLLNYTNEGFIDFGQNTNVASMIEGFQVAPNTWYSFEYELAYDANIQNQSYSALSLQWPNKSNQIQEISINGTLTDTLDNYSFAIPNFNTSNTPNFNGKVSIRVYSSYGAGNLPSGSSNNWGKTIIDAIGGLVKNLLGGLFKKAPVFGNSQTLT